MDGNLIGSGSSSVWAWSLPGANFCWWWHSWRFHWWWWWWWWTILGEIKSWKQLVCEDSSPSLFLVIISFFCLTLLSLSLKRVFRGENMLNVIFFSFVIDVKGQKCSCECGGKFWWELSWNSRSHCCGSHLPVQVLAHCLIFITTMLIFTYSLLCSRLLPCNVACTLRNCLNASCC